MLKNLIGWNTNVHAAPASACGAGDPKPCACGAAYHTPTGGGSTCGGGDNKYPPHKRPGGEPCRDVS